MTTSILHGVCRRALNVLAMLFLFSGTVYAGTVSLSWNANGEADVPGYIVYYGTVSGTYTTSVDVSTATIWGSPSLIDGQQYYFAIKAYTRATGLQSPFSSEVTTMVSAGGAPGQLTIPARNSTLTGSSVQFQWSAGTGVSSYRLSVGTALGGTDIFDQTVGTSLNATVTGLPTNGSTVYARLSSLMNSVWAFQDATYTAYTTLASAPTMTLASTTATTGGAMTVTLANGPGHTTDWIGLYPTAAADGAVLVGEYLNGLTSPPAAGVTGATLTFTAPATAGTYNFRLFSSGSYTKLATSATVTVTTVAGTAGQLTTPAPNSTLTGSSMQFRWSAGTGVSSYRLSVGTTLGGTNIFDQTVGTSLNATATGLPTNGSKVYVRLSSMINSVWAVQDATYTAFTAVTTLPTMTLTSTTAKTGGTITVTLANGPGNPGDWVTLNATTAADTVYLSSQFMNGLTTPPAAGVTGATLRFTMPATPGTYNLRWFVSNTSTKLATSGTITVTAATAGAPTVVVNSSTVSKGGAIAVTVANGPGNTKDWVGLYATAGADGAPLSGDYLNGSTTPPVSGVTGATLQLIAPLTSGTYNVRFFSNGSYTKLATSTLITVP